MPQSVIVAIVALGSMIGMEAVLGVVAVLVDPDKILPVGFALSLGALIMVGFVTGHRLAWQWGRILGLLAAIGYTLVVVLSFTSPKGTDTIWLPIIFGFLAVCLWTIFFAIGRTSAREHFGLRCPKCSQLTNRAADFFFNRAKCKACGNVWR
jgi:hypothetical protein